MLGVPDSPFGNVNTMRFAPKLIDVTDDVPCRAANFEDAARLEDFEDSRRDLSKYWTASRAVLVVAISGSPLLSSLEIRFVEIAVQFRAHACAVNPDNFPLYPLAFSRPSISSSTRRAISSSEGNRPTNSTPRPDRAPSSVGLS